MMEKTMKTLMRKQRELKIPPQKKKGANSSMNSHLGDLNKALMEDLNRNPQIERTSRLN